MHAHTHTHTLTYCIMFVVVFLYYKLIIFDELTTLVQCLHLFLLLPFLNPFTFPLPPYRESIEQLWVRLNDSNPELVSDFEEFICDMSTEVDSAQKALK